MGLCSSNMNEVGNGLSLDDSENKKIKILILGAGECGKSTIFKQMRLLYGEEYSKEDRIKYRDIIYSNMIGTIKTLCELAEEKGITNDIRAQEELLYIKGLSNKDAVNREAGNFITRLFNDPIIQSIWNIRADYQLSESITYYLENLDTVCSKNFIPSNDDILHARVRTSDVHIAKYIIDENVYEFYDVGGQRNERKKWIHHFDNVTAIIFVASLSEYDQVLLENEWTNRMEESLAMFEQICNSPYFEKSSIILFLNKKDIFEKKIKYKSIRDCQSLSHYTGPDSDYNAAIKFILNEFVSRCDNKRNRQIYHHITCATDTSNIRVVFHACKDIILRDALKQSFLL